MQRAELKAMAKQQIKGRIGTLFAAALIVGIISGGLTMIPFIGSIASLILSPALSLGLIIMYLKLTRNEDVQVGNVFDGFSNFGGAFAVSFFSGLFILLWSLLFYIPGIIKAFSYSMASYIIAENPNIGALEAITRSRKMMNGHKMDLFVLSLSFFGWILLSMLTCGILFIWVGPYMNAAMANFYQSIKPVESYEGSEY